MKKFLHIALLIGAVSALMCSCGPKEPATDGKAEFTSFTITAEANPVLELDRDYKAVINNVEGTVIVALPKLPSKVTPNELVPTFTLSKDDVATIDETPLVSGEWILDLSGDPVVVKIEDAMSMVTKEYTLTTEQTDGKCEMVSVGIYVASNEGKVTYDVTAAPNPEGVATLSLSAPVTEVVMSVEATTDDIVTFNGVEGTYDSTSKMWTATVDFSFPIDIVVSDIKAGLGDKTYVVKSINDAYRASWSKIGSIANLPATDYAMDIDPVTGDLYVAHTEASQKEGETKAVNRITVKKWDGSKFVAVGEPAFSAVKASYFSMSARNGKLYVAYSDNTKLPTADGKTKSGRMTIMEYTNGAWTLVGNQGEMGAYQGLSKLRAPIEVAPDNTLVAVTLPGEDFPDWGVTKQIFHLGMWNGQAWSHSGSVATRPASKASYLNRLAVAGNDLYLMCADQNEKTTSVYKYTGGSWTTVVDGFKMDGAVEISTFFGTMKGRENGELYFLLGEQAGGVGPWYLQLFKLAGNTLEKVYDPIKEGQSSDAAFDVEFDAKGTPIIMYRDNAGAEHVKATTIDPDTQTWCYAADLGDSSYSGLPIYLQKDKKGDIYGTYMKRNADKTYEVVLYKKVK